MEARVIETVDQIFIRPPRGDRFSLRQRRVYAGGGIYNSSLTWTRKKVSRD